MVVVNDAFNCNFQKNQYLPLHFGENIATINLVNGKGWRVMNSWYRRFLFEGKHNYHLYIGEGYAGPVSQHRHEVYHCVYVIQGKVMERQYGRETIQNAGECFFTPPGVDHGLYIYENTRYFCLSFSQNIADILFSHINGLRRDFKNLPDMVIVPEEVRDRLHHCLESLMDEQEYEGAPALETAHFLTVSALLMMLRGEFPAKRTAIGSETGDDPTKAEVIRCVQHIHANYDHVLTVEVLSRITTLSRSSINKVFQQYTGKSVKQYVTEVRIKEARRLIGLGKLPLQQIADQVGYKDFSTFYRNFLHITGISPAEYRRKISLSSSEDKSGG